MTETLDCPAKDCDYTGLKKSVLGHYSGKQDGHHPGGWHKAKELLPGGETETAEPETTEQTASKSRETGTNGNPTFGSANPVTEPEPSTQSREQSSRSNEDEPACLDCGSELYDFRQFAAGEYHNLNGTDVYVRGDYQCSKCGKWWVDE